MDSFTVDSSTQITATVTIDDVAMTGDRDVSVTTPSGIDTLTASFVVTLAPPTLTTLYPDIGCQDETLEVVITGTNLTGATAVSFGSGIAVDSFTVDSSTQITTTVTIDDNTTTGERNVSVTTASGTGVLSGSFTVTLRPATISEVSTDSGKRGQTLEVVILGTNFTEATAVSFGNGITVDSFTVDSPTQITATITIDDKAATGSRDILVTTPAGTSTFEDAFTISGDSSFPIWAWVAIAFGAMVVGGVVLVSVARPPTLAALSPSSGLRGETIDVDLSGTGLDRVEKVGFQDGIVVNSFATDSTTQAVANITVDANARAGPRNVSVTVPGFRGGTASVRGGFTVIAGEVAAAASILPPNDRHPVTSEPYRSQVATDTSRQPSDISAPAGDESVTEPTPETQEAAPRRSAGVDRSLAGLDREVQRSRASGDASRLSTSLARQALALSRAGNAEEALPLAEEAHELATDEQQVRFSKTVLRIVRSKSE